jgi:hypothetical protein
VLIALAANAWWAGRSDHRLARDYEVRLIAELEHNRRLIDTVTVHTQHVQLATDSLMMFFEDSADIGGPARVVVNAYNATRRWSIGFTTSTFDELISTGGLRLLPDPDLRAALNELYIWLKDFPREWYGVDYRTMARKAVPVTIQLRIRSECVEIAQIDWDSCPLNLDPGLARRVTKALRTDAALVGAFRVQAHEMSTFRRDLARTRTTIDSVLTLINAR